MYPGSKSPDLNTNAHTPHLPYPMIGSCVKRQPAVTWRRSLPFSSLTVRCDTFAKHPPLSYLPDKPCRDTFPNATTHTFRHTLFGVRPHGPMLVDSMAAMRYRPMGGEGYAHNPNTHTGLKYGSVCLAVNHHRPVSDRHFQERIQVYGVCYVVSATPTKSIPLIRLAS